MYKRQLQHLRDDAEISAVGDVADSCYYLKLGGSLVDREDAGITEQDVYKRQLLYRPS